MSDHARPAIDHVARPPASLSIARVGSFVSSERTIVFTAFVGLVLVLWIPFGPRSGLGYETGFPFESERQSWWDGFFYDFDPLRPYTSVFYQLSYLVGRVAGVTGSFVPYQIVYAALWFARGALTYEIVRRLVPRAGLLPFLAGALVLVHASDGALNWVGQLNQYGMIFWLLLSVYFLVLAVTVESRRWAAVWCVLSLVGVRLCLWSYESGLGLILLAPAVVLLARRRSLDRLRIAYALVYYVPALYYIALAVSRYANGDGSTYQESVMRSDVAVGPIVSDLAFNVEASLRFWMWDDQPPAPGTWPVIVGVLGAGIVIVGGLAVQSRVDRRSDDAVPGRRSLYATAIVGTVLLVASFPAYLLLDSARGLWRTQFLSGIGFGIAVAAAICLMASLLGRHRSRVAAALVLTAVVAYFGATASYGVARFHYQIWDRHRDAIAQILEIAPQFKPDSVIVYTGVPRSADPFGDTMWFDLALKLAYPLDAPTGEYFLDDGTAAPGANLAYRKGRWLETGKGMTPWADDATLSNTVFFSYGRDRAHLLAKPPSRFRTADGIATAYRPARLIEHSPPDGRALRRYGPLHVPHPSIQEVRP